MDARLHEIYTRYNTGLKPLIAEQETRMSAFEEPLLLNLSKMFDNLSHNQGDRFLIESSVLFRGGQLTWVQSPRAISSK